MLKSKIKVADCLRGGATDDDDEADGIDSDEYDEYDEYDEEEVDGEADDEEGSVDEHDSGEGGSEGTGEYKVAEGEAEYQEPYFMSPAIQLYTTFGAMMLSRRVDLFSPVVVRILRFAFIAQLVIQQLFVLYVRIMAKKNNNRTPVKLQNPISGMIQSRLEQQGGDNRMVKNLASSFLSSETTTMEYDMERAMSMQGGVIFNMAFMWFLHFKLERVQPLLIQVLSGFIQLAYHPLFQVYVLGRNLERPFKTPTTATQKIMEAQQSLGVKNDEEPATSTTLEEAVDSESQDDDEDDEDGTDEEDSGEEDEAEDQNDEDEGDVEEEAENEEKDDD